MIIDVVIIIIIIINIIIIIDEIKCSAFQVQLVQKLLAGGDPCGVALIYGGVHPVQFIITYRNICVCVAWRCAVLPGPEPRIARRGSPFPHCYPFL